ncbi:MAG: transcriptional repressor [Deltaproteobacteria bacterium]|nr:transcriptional repressor [Deltaproteobacteria bacterium]
MKTELGPDRRITKQRRVILDILKSLKSHPTADELYDLVRPVMPSISLGTVYRNLEVLSSCGLARTIQGFGNKMRFDGDVSPHHHVICESCGSIGDVWGFKIDASAPDGDAASDFQIRDFEVVFHGLCPRCRGAANHAEEEPTY